VPAGKPVAGICDATVALGRIGLLDDRAHTGNHPGQLRDMVPDYRGAALHHHQPRAVRDRGVITASGAAPVSFAREILQAVGVGSSGMVDYLACTATSTGPRQAENNGANSPAPPHRGPSSFKPASNRVLHLPESLSFFPERTTIPRSRFR
jgi:hypothetical protein